MEKPLLSEFVRAKLNEKHGTIVRASLLLGLTYDRFKRALQTNSFGPDILEKVLPECGLATDMAALSERFTFSMKRQFLTKKLKLQVSNACTLITFISDKDLAFILENQLVKQKISTMIRDECARIRDAI